MGARTAFIVGSPVDVADELQGWVRDADVDGFNLARVVVPETLNAFVDLVVPELQSRGVFKTEYREGPLRRSSFRATVGACPTPIPPPASAISSTRKRAPQRWLMWPAAIEQAMSAGALIYKIHRK